jgi:hypothetical protein
MDSVNDLAGFKLTGEETAVLRWREGATLYRREITLKELREKWDSFLPYTTICFFLKSDDSVWFDEYDRLCIGTPMSHTFYDFEDEKPINFHKKIEMAFTAAALFHAGKTKAEVIDCLDEM